MRQTRLGPLEVRITGGVDGDGGGDGPLVVLAHGFGAPGDDLVPLSEVLDVPSEVRWAFPAAPLDLGSMGFGMESRAWWHIDMLAIERALQSGQERDLSRDHPDGLDEARAMMLETLDALEAELRPSRWVLGGFSQGAMLSLDVALHSERPLAGLVLMSGTLLDEAIWTERIPARAGLEVLQSHGRMDPLLPFSMAERLRDVMTAGGMRVRFIPFSGGHEIPPPALDALSELVTRAAAE